MGRQLASNGEYGHVLGHPSHVDVNEVRFLVRFLGGVVLERDSLGLALVYYLDALLYNLVLSLKYNHFGVALFDFKSGVSKAKADLLHEAGRSVAPRKRVRAGIRFIGSDLAGRQKDTYLALLLMFMISVNPHRIVGRTPCPGSWAREGSSQHGTILGALGSWEAGDSNAGAILSDAWRIVMLRPAVQALHQAHRLETIDSRTRPVELRPGPNWPLVGS